MFLKYVIIRHDTGGVLKLHSRKAYKDAIGYVAFSYEQFMVRFLECMQQGYAHLKSIIINK